MHFFKISAFYFFYFAAVGVYVIYLPKVLHNLNYTTFEIGVVFALAPLMRFATPFLFLKHIKLNQKIFIYALITCVICASLFYLTIHNFYLFTVNNAILGAALSLILPYLEVTAIKLLGKEKYGKARLFGSLGFIVIAFVLGRFLSDYHVSLHYYLLVISLTVVFAFLLLKYDDVDHDEKQSKEPFSFFMYWPLWVSMFFMQLSFGAFYNFFTIYETDHGIDLKMTSYLWIFGVICEVIILFFQSPILKTNLLNIIKFCLFITAIRWLMLYLFPDNLFLTFISQSIHAFSFALYHSATIMFLYSLYENKKLAQQFMYGVAYGLGGFLGALLAGWLYGEYLFLYSAIFSLLAFVFLFNKKLMEKAKN